MVEDVWLDADLPRLLPAFLPAQRWFGGKAREIRAVVVEDALELGDPSYRCALAIVAVAYADGATERYAMMLAFLENEADPTIGRVDSASPRWVVESAADPRAVRALLEGFASLRDIPLRRGGRLQYGDCPPATASAVARAAGSGRVVPLGAEQSNTSVRLDRAFVFKLFRRITAGENPEVEVGRFLTHETTFRAMAALRGSLTYVSARGERSTLGVVQDWIDSQGDGWTYGVTLLRTGDHDAVSRVARDMLALGATTAEFHAALASAPGNVAFTPEPITAADLEGWHAELVGRRERTLRLVERHIGTWSGETRQLGEAFLDLHPAESAPDSTPGLPASEGCHRIRIHGDYHLGQVLRAGDGFVVIDFEGEPTRPLRERRAKHCALKDVAGMIRSFDYAVEAARAEDSRAARTDSWPAELREAFVEGYLSVAALDRVPLFPRDRRAMGAWIDRFELDKALYEVDYEINNRPDWVRIPLRGVLRILSRRS